MLNKVISFVFVLVLSGVLPSVAQSSEPALTTDPTLIGPAATEPAASEPTRTSESVVTEPEISSIASTEVAQNPPASEAELSYEELRRFARAFSVIKNQYVEPVSEKDLVNAAIEGMLQDLDPHSVYLNKEDMEDLQEETDGEFGGLGIEIGEESGYVKVIAPIESTPAARAGILPGDLILKVNGENMKDKPINEVVKLLRGDAGSEIVLTIKRASSEENIDFTLTRELIKVQSVRSKMIGETAYFRISQFQANTVGDLAVQIRRISERYTPSSVILDLRNDPGGLLNVAVGVVQAFTDTDKVIVSTKARDQLVEEFSAYMVENLNYGTNPLRNLPKWTNDAPMVVLINVGSASASEIVAGALQDFKRATVMGTRSFGKGSVQVVMSIDEETGIKLTTARYYTPLGRSIQATGITPDIVVSDTEKGDLFSFSREVDLADHLENESQKKSSDTAAKPKNENRPSSEDVFEFGSEQDFQLQQALNLLNGQAVNQGVVSEEQKIKPAASTEGVENDRPKDELLNDMPAANSESVNQGAAGGDAAPATPADASAAEPTSVEPSKAEPSATEPAAVEPSADKPAAADPSAVEPKAAEPKAAEPASEPSKEPAKEPAATETQSDSPAKDTKDTKDATEDKDTKPAKKAPEANPNPVSKAPQQAYPFTA